MKVEITEAATASELDEILVLQKKNHRDHVSVEEGAANGFLSVKHDPKVLKAMNEAYPQIIAKAEGSVIGFALVMPPIFGQKVPELIPLFTTLQEVLYQGKKIKEYNYYVMGQICIGEGYRSQGVFDRLYQKHKELYSGKFEICVTEIATGNTRSLKAHRRVGFEVIHTFRDAIDEWNIVVWNWK